MSKRELANHRAAEHDPRMWESNGEGVLVRKKKIKETNYLCDADDSDGEKYEGHEKYGKNW